jgi:chromosome segregation ATPase
LPLIHILKDVGFFEKLQTMDQSKYSEIAKSIANISDVPSLLAKSFANISDVPSLLAEQDAEISRKDAKIKELEGEISKKEDEISKKEDESSKKEDEYQSLKKQYDKEKEEHYELQQINKAGVVDLGNYEKLQTEHAKLLKENQQLTATCESVKSHNYELKTELEEQKRLRQQYKERADKADEYKSSAENWNRENEILTARLTEMATKAENAEKIVKECKKFYLIAIENDQFGQQHIRRNEKLAAKYQKLEAKNADLKRKLEDKTAHEQKVAKTLKGLGLF